MANDGTINVDNVQTISGMTMSEILEQMKNNGGGGNVNISGGGTYVIRDYSDIITGTIVTGAEVTMSGMPWIVASIEPSRGIFYLISKHILGSCKFAESATNYTKSTLAKTLNTMLDTIDENVQEKLIPMLIGGLTQKIHAPTYGQITRWFTEDSSRIAMYESASCKYWLCDNGYDPEGIGTSTSTSYALIVNTTGDCAKKGGMFSPAIQELVNTTQGFRAVVALMM